MSELKPCAHCDCEAEEKTEYIFHYLRCSNPECYDGVHWVTHVDKDKLYDAWNRRANDA
ncbi:MAG: hypothetical protein IJW29_02120 [Clostridia bacterium]|nr:hypothetical protein [Clostridia bacterium]